MPEGLATITLMHASTIHLRTGFAAAVLPISNTAIVTDACSLNAAQDASANLIEWFRKHNVA
jgi:hypothetical protein